MDVYNIITVFTAISFIVYGINSFTSKKMISEFKRWGLQKRRKLSVILIIGFCFHSEYRYTTCVNMCIFFNI